MMCSARVSCSCLWFRCLGRRTALQLRPLRGAIAAGLGEACRQPFVRSATLAVSPISRFVAVGGRFGIRRGGTARMG